MVPAGLTALLLDWTLDNLSPIFGKALRELVEPATAGTQGFEAPTAAELRPVRSPSLTALPLWPSTA